MLKKSFVAVIFMTLVLASLSWAQIDKIGIFTEAVSQIDPAAALAVADFVMNNVESAEEIAVYNEADLAEFAVANTGDGDVDIIITFGFFPASLYKIKNGQPDGSIGELFLEGGDIFLNTGDYIFYVTGAAAWDHNGSAGLKNMTDSSFDMWTEDEPHLSAATADGKEYTPSLVGFNIARGFQISQVDDDADWEMEVVFGSDGGDVADPAIIRNLTYGGRVGIALQGQSNVPVPRGEVFSEMIDNFLATRMIAVEPGDKLAVTWGGIK